MVRVDDRDKTVSFVLCSKCNASGKAVAGPGLLPDDRVFAKDVSGEPP